MERLGVLKKEKKSKLQTPANMLIGRTKQQSQTTGNVSALPAPPPPLTGSGRQWRQCLRSAAAYLHQSSQLDREEKESPAQPCQ